VRVQLSKEKQRNRMVNWHIIPTLATNPPALSTAWKESFVSLYTTLYVILLYISASCPTINVRKKHHININAVAAHSSPAHAALNTRGEGHYII